MRTSGDKKEKLPIKNDEESSLVAEGALENAFYIISEVYYNIQSKY
jgi:hypothetical protein